jgi:multicomponent Na+:H+ antiporter subunit B
MTEPDELVSRVLFAVALPVSASMLVGGYDAAGDGFSAGVLASLAAVIQYLCLGREAARRLVFADRARSIGVSGLALMFAVAFVPLAFSEPPVTHFPRPSSELPRVGALKLHTAVLFDLGVFLLVYGAIVSIVDRFLSLPEESC